jgi:hypothetical protein
MKYARIAYKLSPVATSGASTANTFTFNLNGLTIREDADIDKLSTAIASKITAPLLGVA